ncbi:MAG: hypothetical protein MUO67_25740 [Anaerolineales bacterium]|nr:hypothetical protein [Anaerolineales bacterium]
MMRVLRKIGFVLYQQYANLHYFWKRGTALNSRLDHSTALCQFYGGQHV